MSGLRKVELVAAVLLLALFLPVIPGSLLYSAYIIGLSALGSLLCIQAERLRKASRSSERKILTKVSIVLLYLSGSLAICAVVFLLWAAYFVSHYFVLN